MVNFVNNPLIKTQTPIEVLLAMLLDYGSQNEWFEANDRVYHWNRLLDFMGLPGTDLQGYTEVTCPHQITVLLEAIVAWAYGQGRISSPHPDTADYFDTALVDCLLPRPSQIAHTFRTKYNQAPDQATNWYYQFSQATQYIRTERVAKNTIWHQPTPYGDMVFTINLSKPEKDPKAIAAQGKVMSANYPKCLLCYENVGYGGHTGHPARHNHRVIDITLAGEPWFFQYSPYVYYKEHLIAVSKAHTPMAITAKTFERLLDFVEQMPHYFIGSNADLPIVGGSMLSHDHYQGGCFEMPMAKALPLSTLVLEGWDDVSMAWLKWPLTTLRLKSKDRYKLSTLANKILTTWRSYNDEILDLRAEEHTITPIARMREGVFELDLVLRSCQVSGAYPDGVYHPHPEIHHVKKENIGLIEVMGLAVLPPRLQGVGQVMAEALSMNKAPDHLVDALQVEFLEMYRDLYAKSQSHQGHSGDFASLDACWHSVQEAIGQYFVTGLEHCGVMPLNARGDAARSRFEKAIKEEV